MLQQPRTVRKQLAKNQRAFFAKGKIMKARNFVIALAILFTGLLTGVSFAPAGQDKKAAEEKKTGQDKKGNTAIIPTPFQPQRHEGFVEIAKKGDIDILFMGDSITDGWRSPKSGKPVFDKHFAPLKTANFGIGGDRTQGVLWRMENGELEGYTPKLMMLMIGTNNIGGMKKDGTFTGNTPEEIAEGIKAVIDKFRGKFPQAKVLLLGVFPRNVSPDSAQRKSVNNINKIISKYDDGKYVRYMDIGDKFLDKDGKLPADVMPDALHPNLRGYEIWAEAVLPTIHEMLGKKN
jgi:lysophospholipase L1-like esterase